MGHGPRSPASLTARAAAVVDGGGAKQGASHGRAHELYRLPTIAAGHDVVSLTGAILTRGVRTETGPCPVVKIATLARDDE